jgi:hypothetical protein
MEPVYHLIADRKRYSLDRRLRYHLGSLCVNSLQTSQAALLLFLIGCGDDDMSRPQAVIDLDGGTLDGGPTISDASVLDATSPDATADASNIVLCTFSQSAIVQIANDVSSTDPISLAVRNDGVSLAAVELVDGVPRFSRYWFARNKQDVFTPLPNAGRSLQSEPATVATATGFLTAWNDNEQGLDLKLQGVAADGTTRAPLSTKLTSNGDSDDESLPVMATGSTGNVLVVWQNGGTELGTAQLVSPDGTPVGTPQRIANLGPNVGPLALAALGTGYVLAWIDTVHLRVHMVLLSESGAAKGADILVDAEGNAGSVLDIATNDTGGALVFDVFVSGSRPEVRFHAFDMTGTLTGAERVVTDFPATGSSPSLVPIAGGYVVAYRSKKSPDYTLQLARLDRAGAVLQTVTAGPLVDTVLPVALRITPDGSQMFLSWVDRIASTGAYQLQRSWVECD